MKRFETRTPEEKREKDAYRIETLPEKNFNAYYTSTKPYYSKCSAKINTCICQKPKPLRISDEKGHLS